MRWYARQAQNTFFFFGFQDEKSPESDDFKLFPRPARGIYILYKINAFVRCLKYVLLTKWEEKKRTKQNLR